MIVAHLPAGYLLARRWSGPVAAAALLGSVLPDLDMAWFHLVDGRAVHHHRYLTHVPGFWAALGGVVALALWALGRERALACCGALLAGVALHLALDWPVGGLMWLWPLDDRLFALVTVPARFDWWVWSFVLHWSFAAEVAIVLAAAWALRLDVGRRAAAC